MLGNNFATSVSERSSITSQKINISSQIMDILFHMNQTSIYTSLFFSNLFYFSAHFFQFIVHRFNKSNRLCIFHAMNNKRNNKCGKRNEFLPERRLNNAHQLQNDPDYNHKKTSPIQGVQYDVFDHIFFHISL